jgi:hypothetical protein
MNPTLYGSNLGSADTRQRWSPTVWRNCPVNEFRTLGNGIVFEDRFLSAPITPPTTEGNWGSYAAFSSTGGTINPYTAAAGGGVTLGSDGDNEGASIRTLCVPFRISRSHLDFAFECRLQSSTIDNTKHGFFVGLMQNVALTATVPIAAAGTLADTNLVGFHRLEGDGDQIDCVYKADGVTQVTVQADALPTALVADTPRKLGITFSPNDYYLRYFVDGIQVASYQVVAAAGTDFPNDISLGLVFAVLNATATTPGDTTLFQWRAAQRLEQ